MEKVTFLQTDHRSRDTCRGGRQYLFYGQGRWEVNKRGLTRAHVTGDMLRTGESGLADGTLVVAAHLFLDEMRGFVVI